VRESETFRRLEQKLGAITNQQPGWPLERWYEKVRDLSILEFSDGDLCIACRQDVHLTHVLPVAIDRVLSDPLAGDNYDGELLVAIASIPASRWGDIGMEKERLCRYVKSLKCDVDDSDVNAAIQQLRYLCR